MPGLMLHPSVPPPLCGPSRLWHPFAVAVALAALPLGAGAQESPALCPSLVQQVTPAPFRESRPDPNAPIDITSDRAIVGEDGNVDLQGDVIVHQGERELQGEDAHYSRSSNGFEVKGNVIYQDPLVRITGRNGRYSPVQGGGFNQAEFEFRQRPARGSAQTLDLTNEGILRLSGVIFTTCPRRDQSWLLRARELTLDTVNRVGTARGAEVDFKHVPILYLPWMTFPLSADRKSGFLFPTIGNSSRNGVQVEVPYYFNIAPNYDLTFNPIYYSKRGVDLGGDARLLTSDQNGEVIWHFLPNDQEFASELGQSGSGAPSGNNRSYVQVRDTIQLPEGMRLRIDAANVSDVLYFQDFGYGPEATSISFVERLARLTYADDNWRAALQAQQYQTLDLSLRTADGPNSPVPAAYADYEPYARAPWAYAEGRYALGPDDVLRLGVDSELVDFTRSVGVIGWRLDLTPHIGLDLENPALFVRPEIAWRYTRYALTDILPGMSANPVRALPIASFDTGVRLERPMGKHAQHTLTLEPRLQYLYVPYRNQDQLPVFDTALPDLNIVELFRTNQFVGADRQSNADQVTVGVTSRLLDTASGRQFIAATLGQTYYFQSQRVLLPGQVPVNRATSDLIAEIDLTAFNHWNAQLGEQWSPDWCFAPTAAAPGQPPPPCPGSQNERTFVQVQFKPAAQSVVNVAYRYQRAIFAPSYLQDGVLVTDYTLERMGLKQAEISAAWPLTRSWNVLARTVYAIDAGEPLDSIAGFEYHSCCWGVRMIARRYLVNSTGEQDTAFMLQLELTGLASVGSAPDAFLGTAIRGYSRSTTTP